MRGRAESMCEAWSGLEQNVGCLSSGSGEQMWLECRGQLAGQQQPSLWKSIGREPGKGVVGVLSSPHHCLASSRLGLLSAYFRPCCC